jgi:hypothetical protein
MIGLSLLDDAPQLTPVKVLEVTIDDNEQAFKGYELD